MAFGYSPVSGCFVVHVTHSPLERTAGHVGLVFHQWNVSPILWCLSSRESMVHLRRGLRPHRYHVLHVRRAHLLTMRATTELPDPHATLEKIGGLQMSSVGALIPGCFQLTATC